MQAIYALYAPVVGRVGHVGAKLALGLCGVEARVARAADGLEDRPLAEGSGDAGAVCDVCLCGAVEGAGPGDAVVAEGLCSLVLEGVGVAVEAGGRAVHVFVRADEASGAGLSVSACVPGVIYARIAVYAGGGGVCGEGAVETLLVQVGGGEVFVRSGCTWLAVVEVAKVARNAEAVGDGGAGVGRGVLLAGAVGAGSVAGEGLVGARVARDAGVLGNLAWDVCVCVGAGNPTIVLDRISCSIENVDGHGIVELYMQAL